MHETTIIFVFESKSTATSVVTNLIGVLLNIPNIISTYIRDKKKLLDKRSNIILYVCYN